MAMHVPLTYEDYCKLPDDGTRHELIEGELYVVPSPNTSHQTVSRRLQYALMTQLEASGHAWVFNAPMDLILEATTVVQPDLFIVRRERRAIITERATEAAPDVVVEILSPSSRGRDQVLKRRIYERFGVPEYWVVEPDAQALLAWRIGPEGYQLRAALDRDGTLTSPDFPGLRVSLADLFKPL